MIIKTLKNTNQKDDRYQFPTVFYTKITQSMDFDYFTNANEGLNMRKDILAPQTLEGGHLYTTANLTGIP